MGSRLLALLRRQRLEQELDDEIRSHLAMAADENRRRGMNSEEAERLARRDFGGLEQVKEVYREQRSIPFLERLQRGVRFGLRSLRRSPTFTVIAVTTLALGVGANTAVFSVLNAVLLKPLPYEQPDRLVTLWETNNKLGKDRDGPAPGNFHDWRTRNTVFDGMAAWSTGSRVFDDGSNAEELKVATVTEDFFEVLGTPPAIGRAFYPEEVTNAAYRSSTVSLDGTRVVVVSHDFWNQRLGADPSVVGQTISLGGEPWRVAGVMPKRFFFLDRDVQLWLPWDVVRHRNQKRPGPPRDFRYLRVVAKLQPDVDVGRARADLSAIAASLSEEYPTTNTGWDVRITYLSEEVLGDVGPALHTLFAAVGLVLLIACCNVGNLMLTRALGRGRDDALRLALGAARFQLIAQMLTEALLVALGGAVVGLFLARFLLGFLVSLGVNQIPRLGETTLDTPVLLFAFAVSLTAALGTALLPALATSSANPNTVLGQRGSATMPPTRRKLRDILVVSEVALALMLLIGAGLLVRSMSRLQALNPGFERAGVLVMPMSLNPMSYRGRDQVLGYYAALIARLRALPGVESAAAVTALPMDKMGNDFDRPYWKPGQEPVDGGGPETDIRIATSGYFRTLGMLLLRGRDFGDQDRHDSSLAVIVNESMARLVWPNQDPIGERLVVDFQGVNSYEVVGVVGDTRHSGLREKPRAQVFFPHAQKAYGSITVVVRTLANPELLTDAARRAALEVDPSQPPRRIVTLERLTNDWIATERFSMALLLSMAGLALLLAVVGVYGVTSYYTSQRTLEMGLRMALGARPLDVFRSAFARGFTLVVVGVGVGLAAALSLTRFLQSQLFDVGPADPPTFAAVSLLFLGTAALACYFPARRVTKLDPSTALRHG